MERMLPVIKGVSAGLAVLILLMVALYFIPLPGAGDTAALDRVSAAMRTVRAVPAQHQPLVTLKEATLALPSTADTELVAAMRVVVALGELRTGDRTTGTRLCEYIVATYSNAPAAQLVKFDAISETCKTCKGTGRIAETLKSSAGNVQTMDGDTVQCLRCRGKGRVMSDSAVDAQYPKALSAADAAIKAQDRTGALLSFLLRFQYRLHKAFGRTVRSPAPTTTPATNAPPATKTTTGKADLPSCFRDVSWPSLTFFGRAPHPCCARAVSTAHPQLGGARTKHPEGIWIWTADSC